MDNFTALHPLDDFFGDVNIPKSGKGVTVTSIEGLGIVQVFASKGKAEVVEKALGIKETPGVASATRSYTALPICPGQWVLVSAKPDPKDFAGSIAKKLKKNGYVSEQTDSRVILRLSGSRARELMQKGCRLDLHPSVTSKGWCAQTQMAQIGVLLHQIDAKPTYDLYVYSGFARDFADWLLHTGSQLDIGFSR